MHEADKAAFAQTCLKENVTPVDIQQNGVGHLIVDGGWFLRQHKWEKGDNWGMIISGYVQYVQSLGNHAQNIEVI